MRSVCSHFRRHLLGIVYRELYLHQLWRGHPRHFTPKLRFKLGELGINVLRCLTLADHLFAVATEEIIDGLHTNPDGTRRLVLIEILKAEVGRAGLLHNAFDDAVDGRVMSALETRDFESHEVGMPGCKLGGPDFVIGAAGVRILPRVGDIERAGDNAGPYLFAEKPLE